MLIFGTNIGLKLFKIKVATILNIDMNFFLLEDILVLKSHPKNWVFQLRVWVYPYLVLNFAILEKAKMNFVRKS